MRLTLLVLLAACVPRVDTDDLRRCDPASPGVDCCTSDDGCNSWFGEQFPWCQDPGIETGRCVECRVDEDCDLDATCEPHPEFGAYCAPIPPAEQGEP